MRLWSLAPRVFDLKGLGAQWAEALLASSVMYKRHGGFARHTQLNRFRSCVNRDVALDSFLHNVWLEGTTRGYKYQLEKLGNHKVPDCPVCRGNSDITLTHPPDEAAEVALALGIQKLSAAGEPLSARTIPVTVGQVCFEWRLLLRRLMTRDAARYNLLRRVKLVFGSRRAFCKEEVIKAGVHLHSAGGASYYIWRDQTRVVQLPPTGIDWIPAISENTDKVNDSAGTVVGDSTWLEVRPEDTCGGALVESDWVEHKHVFAPELASRVGVMAESCPLGEGEREVTVHAELLLHHVFRVVAGGVEDFEVAFREEIAEQEKAAAAELPVHGTAK